MDYVSEQYQIFQVFGAALAGGVLGVYLSEPIFRFSSKILRLSVNQALFGKNESRKKSELSDLVK